MGYVTSVVSVLFLLKIFWNLTVPYVLAARSFDTDDERAGGISLMPIVELVLLGIIILLACIGGGLFRTWGIGTTALIGATIVVASYGHLVVAGVIAGWLAKKLRE
jgi:hypothetical protein